MLALLGEGLGNAQIADRMGLAPSTVKDHVRALLAKLGGINRIQAAIVADRAGLVTGTRRGTCVTGAAGSAGGTAAAAAGSRTGRRGGGCRSRPVVVPVLLAVADALLVNGVELALELGVSMVAAAALLLRRRFPLLVFLFTLPGLYIGYIWFAPMIALYTLAALRPGPGPARHLCAAADRRALLPVSDLRPRTHRVPREHPGADRRLRHLGRADRPGPAGPHPPGTGRPGRGSDPQPAP